MLAFCQVNVLNEYDDDDDEYLLIFWLLIQLNTIKIRFKVLTFRFSRLRPFSELWRHLQEDCFVVKCSLTYGQIASKRPNILSLVKPQKLQYSSTLLILLTSHL